jgi:hypothetical protein
LTDIKLLHAILYWELNDFLMTLKESVASCLEGLVFVTNGSKGHKLVWYYDCRLKEKESTNLVFRDAAEESEEGSAGKDCTAELFGGLDMTSVVDMLSPKVGLCDKRFQLILDQTTYIGHPVTVIQDDVHAEGGTEGTLLSMSLFHVVFLLRSTRQRLLDAMYQWIIKPLSMALRHEQARCGYVRNEVEAILSAYVPDESKEQLQNRLYQLSQLVRELSTIADTLKKKEDINIRIHRWIRFNTSLDSVEMSEIPIYPYQTMLLTDSASEMILSLPEETSPLLIKILQNVHPRKRYVHTCRSRGRRR